MRSENNIRQSVLNRLKVMGFKSMLQFWQANPILSFCQLASAIGMDGVPPVLVVSILREETISNNRWDYFVKTIFVRCVTEHFPMGWMIGPNAEYRSARVYADWAAIVGKERPSAIGDRIGTLMPNGWIPTGVEDPIVMKLFDGLIIALRPREGT